MFKNSYTYSMKGLKFDIIPSRFEETLDKSAFKHPHEYVLENSKQKALEVAGRIDKVSVSCTCMYLTNKEASTVLCSVVKHAGSGRARKKCRGKHET